MCDSRTGRTHPGVSENVSSRSSNRLVLESQTRLFDLSIRGEEIDLQVPRLRDLGFVSKRFVSSGRGGS